MIGIFDSDFGGLTILKELVKQLPQYDYVYLGDNARAPYGNKSQEVIYNYTSQAVDFLFKQACQLIIIACNTASTKALRKIQQDWLPKHQADKRVLGVIIPIAETAASSSRFGRIGVVGTRATIESGVYDIELSKLKTGLKTYNQACPLLVPLIEEGWLKKRETKMVLKKYLRPLKAKRIDALILGCTHYPLLIKEVQKIMGKNCRVLDSPNIVADKLKDYLERHQEIDIKLGKQGQRIFFTSDNPEKFRQFSLKFLDIKINEVKKIDW